jgi:hypothetical protein
MATAAASAQPTLWSRLAAPIPPERIGWRQDGKPVNRNGSFYARFVAYIDAQTVAERLDACLPGWSCTLDVLPTVVKGSEEIFNVKATITAGEGVTYLSRENIGSGRDLKSAATDAFKRAGVQFGIGKELYHFKPNWVKVDSDSKYAKPIENPGTAYARQHGGPVVGANPAPSPVADAPEYITPPPGKPYVTPDTDGTLTGGSAGNSDPDNPQCPTCGGKMWDNREGKKNPKAPDFKCRDRSCDGVIWPKKKKEAPPPPPEDAPPLDDADMPPDDDDLSDLPF